MSPIATLCDTNENEDGYQSHRSEENRRQNSDHNVRRLDQVAGHVEVVHSETSQALVRGYPQPVQAVRTGETVAQGTLKYW